MDIKHLHVQNFRALKDVDIPLSQFACIVGENNAGKSSLLQAVRYALEGGPMPATNYHDESQPIRIALTFGGIEHADLERLAVEHRQRIESVIVDGQLTLVRHYGADGKGRILYVAQMPNDPRFS